MGVGRAVKTEPVDAATSLRPWGRSMQVKEEEDEPPSFVEDRRAWSRGSFDDGDADRGRFGQAERSPPSPRLRSLTPPLPEMFDGYPAYHDVAPTAIAGTKPTFRTSQGAFIDQRAQLERPGRTLFVRNVRVLRLSLLAR